MNIDSILQHLSAAADKPEFNLILSRLMKERTSSDQLLLKMEIKRLMLPCRKAIDMRSSTTETCHSYQLDGLQHWLDDSSFARYQQYRHMFKGYTQHVWEKITKRHKQPQKSNLLAPQMTANPYHIEAIALGQQLQRKENRLSLFSQVSIMTQADLQFDGVCCDLSESGAKFKVPAGFKFTLGEDIHVIFSELIHRAHDTQSNNYFRKPVTFRILSIDPLESNQDIVFLRALRLNHPAIVKNVIEFHLNHASKKNRYQYQDKILTMRSNGYEHIYLKHTAHLPLFFHGNELLVAMLNDNNESLWNYWHNEKNQQTLSAAFTTKRMNMLLQPGVKQADNLLYVFTHQHKHEKLFYSMLLPESTPDLRRLFCHIGAKRDSWKVFHLTMHELSPQERQALSTHRADLSKIPTHCGFLKQINNPIANEDYLLNSAPKLPSKAIASFRQEQIEHTVQGIVFDARNRREEPRYQFKTLLKVKFGDNELKGQSYNISAHGLYLQINKPTTLTKGDLVSVEFSQLQHFAPQLDLDNIVYHVIRVSHNSLRLRLKMQTNSLNIKASQFLHTLISSNQARFAAEQECRPEHDLITTLQQLLLNKLNCYPLFAQQKDNRIEPAIIAEPLESHHQHPFFSALLRYDYFDLSDLFTKHLRSNILTTELKKSLSVNKPQVTNIYISRQANQFNDIIYVKTHQCFANTQERIEFIRNAQRLGEFWVLQFTSIAIDDPLTTRLLIELEKLSRISMPLATTVEKELLTIQTYGEFDDITEEVLIRLELST